MNCYKYNENGFYLGVGNCQIDPLESQIQGQDVFLLPANATFTGVPNTQIAENHSWIWNGSAWVDTYDCSKEVFYKKSDRSVLRYEFGETPDLVNYTISVPIENENFQIYDENTSSWVVDTVSKDAHEKQIQIGSINSNFYNECKNVGVSFEGNYFQYDDISRARLQETKDDSRVTFWRSVDNLNVLMDNAKKNELYELLKLTYYTKFAEKSALIDAL